MTRETKIGLLVGLAFIIVIGILLSDHMTSTIEPPLAALQLAGPNVRSGLGQPASDNAPPVVVVPPNVAPRQPVNIAGQDVASLNAAKTNTASNNHPVSTKNNDVPADLRQVAKNAGEDLVDVNASNTNTTTSDATAAVEPVKLVPARTYKAQPGDSLTKIAAKMYGSSSKANRDAIIAANPTLKDNPNRIIVGRTYSIPPLNSAAPVKSAAVAQAPAAAAPVPMKPVSEPQYTYVVQPGDSLWSIAVDQLGNANTLAAIKELNKDVLKGSDRVRPNMKLRLPAKPVAMVD